MRFVSYRRSSGKWICCCIVRRWRPVYDKINTRLAGMEGLAQWYIVTQEEWDGFTARTARSSVASDATN